MPNYRVIKEPCWVSGKPLKVGDTFELPRSSPHVHANLRVKAIVEIKEPAADSVEGIAPTTAPVPAPTPKPKPTPRPAPAA